MIHSIKHNGRELIVVGDRILIQPEQANERTDVGLYLPQTVMEKEKIQSGRIVATGPGIPLPEPNGDESEPWKTPERKARYVPIQAQEGDTAIFLRKAAVEIKLDGQEYLIVPHSAILLLLRE